MKENLKEIMAYLKKARSELKKYIFDNKKVLKQEKIEGNGWSPVEVLDHLYKTEIFITGLLGRQLERAVKKGLKAREDSTSYLHSLDQFEIEIVKEKYNAPEQSMPDRSTNPETILLKMDGSRAELILLLHQFSDFDMEGMEFPHPAYGRMNMLQRVVFIGKHEHRHLNQIRQITKLS